MATDVERLLVRLEVSQNRFDRQMAQMERRASRGARAVETRFAAMNRTIQAQFVGLGARLGGALAGALTIQSAAGFIDSSIRIQNALKATGLEGEQLTAVYDQLFAAAQKNSAPIESLVQLYSRLAINQRELNTSSAELVQFSGTIAAVLRAGGTSAQEASGALLQLSQALGGGVVRAEEFNSILEGAPTIARAAAYGIKEAGGSVAELRKLMLDGQISSEAFFRGIEAGAPAVTQAMGDAERTISDSFTNLYNSLTRAAAEFNDSSEAANLFGTALDNLATFVEGINFDTIIGEIDRYITGIGNAITATTNFMAELGRLSGLENVGRFLEGSAAFRMGGFYSTANRRDRLNAEPYPSSPELEAYINRRRGSAPAQRSGRVARAGFAPTPINPISVADYAPPAEPGKGSSGRRGGGGRSGRGRSSEQALDREIEQIRERTAAVQAETAAMAGLNPVIDDYGFSVAKVRAEQDLLNAAKKAGIAVTPALREQIATLASGYASASVEARKLSESQDKVRQRAEEFAAMQKGVVSGFISDLRGGTSAADALANSLQKVADKLIEISLNSIFDGGGLFGGGAGGGLLGGIGKILGFSKGTANTGGVRGQARGIVHGQEAVIPLPAGGKVPVEVRQPQMAAARPQNVHVTVGVAADGNGNLMPFVANVADQRAQVRVAQGQQRAETVLPVRQRDMERRRG